MNFRLRKAVVLALTVLTVTSALPWHSVQGQFNITIDLEIIQDFVNVTVSETEDRTLTASGTITVTKPPSPLIVVEVSLSSSVPANFTSSIEPDGMQFASTGTEQFTLTIIVPAGTKNITNATATVQGIGTSDGFQTVEDHDDLLIIVEYPIVDDPNGQDDSPVPPDIGPNPFYYCGASIVIGGLAGGLLYWKRKGQRAKDFEVVYRPRRRTRPSRPKAQKEEVLEGEIMDGHLEDDTIDDESEE